MIADWLNSYFWIRFKWLEVLKMITGKVVVLGSQGKKSSLYEYCVSKLFLGVGKTSTCIRYIEKHFNHHTVPTIAAAFYSATINVLNKDVNLQVSFNFSSFSLLFIWFIVSDMGYSRTRKVQSNGSYVLQKFPSSNFDIWYNFLYFFWRY